MEGRRIAGVILAAGRSSRMGDFKALKLLDNKPALQWGVDAFVLGGVSDVRVVTGFNRDNMDSYLGDQNLLTVVNPQPERGMLSSVQCAVASMGTSVDGLLLLPVDMPMVRPQTIKRLLKAAETRPDKILYPVFNGQRGHPPLIPQKFFSAILESEQDCILRDILKGFESESEEIGCPDSGILMDMDTPEDFQEMVEYCQGRRIPTVAESEMLLRIHQTPERVVRHCEAVAALAADISARLNRFAGMNLNTRQIYAAGLLHDIARELPAHGKAGADILCGEGFEDLAESISVHMDLELPEGPFDFGCSEILYLADKLVDEDRLVTLEERFGRAFQGKGAAVPDKVAARLRTAQRIKDGIERTLGVEELCRTLYPLAQ